MNAKEAAKKVLGEAGEPLHYGEITRRCIERGWWSPEGKTPEATMNAQLSVEIKRMKLKSVFVRTAPAMFGLRKWNVPEYPGRRGEGKKTYSFTDAAELVLKGAQGKGPMHYREITHRALGRGMLATSGQTPEATMYAQILQEIKRAKARGDQPRFVKHGRGYVGLSEWLGRGLAFEIEQHNRRIREKLRKQLYELTPSEFEEIVAELLVALGFQEVEVTARSGDGGIDVRGVLVIGDAIRTRMSVQVKRWKQNVQKPVVQQVRGSLGTHEQGLIITTSGFSKGATDEAERGDAIPVGLMNGEQMAALLVEHGIGVDKSSYDILELKALGAEEE